MEKNISPKSINEYAMNIFNPMENAETLHIVVLKELQNNNIEIIDKNEKKTNETPLPAEEHCIKRCCSVFWT
jgi:hypothetical protein